MTVPEFDELLSAYLDGEATPEERALVERKLEGMPALRETLDEFADVGEAIRALPRTPAPQGLASGVMKSLREAPALPLPAAEKSPDRLSAAPGHSFRAHSSRTRRRWLLGSVAAVCCLAVVTTLSMRANRGPRPVADLAVRSATPGERSLSPENEFATTADSSSEMQGESGRLAIDPARESELLRDLIANDGRPPELGKVFRVLYDNASEVHVLEYVVADVDDSAGQMRMLLERNGIQPLGLETSDSVVVSAPLIVGSVTSPSSGARLVYFEGGESQVQDAVKEFEESPSIITVNDYGALAESKPKAESDSVSDAQAQAAGAGLVRERAESGFRKEDETRIADGYESGPPPPDAASEDRATLLGDQLDGLSRAVKAAEQASEQTARRTMGRDQLSLEQVNVANGVAVDLPQQAAPPMIDYFQNSRSPIAQYGNSQRRDYSPKGLSPQAASAEKQGRGISRVLIIMQSAGSGGGGNASGRALAAPGPAPAEPVPADPAP